GEEVVAVEMAERVCGPPVQAPEGAAGARARGTVQLEPGGGEGSNRQLVGPKTGTFQGTTSDLPSRVDAIQMEENEGPCLSAAFNHRTVRIPDMQNEQRWPRFSRRAAAETGVRGMLAFQLFVEDENLGALNLYEIGRAHVW